MLKQVNGLDGARGADEPNPACTTDALSVAIDADGIDPEGEPVSYRFEWFRASCAWNPPPGRLIARQKGKNGRAAFLHGGGGR